METEVDLTEAIIQIAGLAVLFFVCSLLCYCLCTYLLKEEGKNDIKPETVAWERKHYYDPLPSTTTPPSILCQPTMYSFKVHNGSHPHAQPQVVINPAILQYPPGHVLEQRQIPAAPVSPDPRPKSNRNNASKLASTIDLKTYGFRGKSPVRNGGLGDPEGWIA